MLFSWYKRFFSQPHQPFFTSGILFFTLFMILFILVYSNILVLDTSILTYHAYSMVFVVFLQFFLGFLFVVFPKFLMQAEISEKIYKRHFFAYFFNSLCIFLSLIFYSKITFVFQIFLLITQIFSFKLLLNIHKKSLVQIKNDTKWVLIAFFVGLISHFLFIISNLDFKYSFFISKIAINSGFYLFLFMIFLTISQRMIPFFTRAKVPNHVAYKSLKFLKIVFILLILKIVILSFDDVRFNLISDIPLFFIITKELIKWKLPIFKVEAIIWILYLGLYWIVLGFFISIIESFFAIYNSSIYFEKIVVHSFALGYFLTLLIGFGTRVILGHSGNQIVANKFTVIIFIALQFIVLLRLFSSICSNFGLDYIFFLNLTAILLVLVLLVWSSKYITILLKGK